MNSKIKLWLDSGEYKTDIDSIRTNIIKNCLLSENESQTSKIFENELYFTIKSKTGYNVYPVNEYAISGIKHKFGNLTRRTSGKGRLDAIVNNLIIEYKHHTKFKTKEQIDLAINQVIDYLDAMYNNDGIKYHAILTDGLKICYFQFMGDNVHFSGPSQLSNDSIDTIIKAILSNQYKSFVTFNILNDFQINANADTISKDVAHLFYSCLKYEMTEKTNMLYYEWKSLMHLSIEDNGKSNDVDKRRRDLSLIFEDVIDEPEKEWFFKF